MALAKVILDVLRIRNRMCQLILQPRCATYDTADVTMSKTATARARLKPEG